MILNYPCRFLLHIHGIINKQKRNAKIVSMILIGKSRFRIFVKIDINKIPNRPKKIGGIRYLYTNVKLLESLILFFFIIELLIIKP